MASWKDILRTVAPTAATLLGGPAAGAAVTMLSRTLLNRDDASEAEIAAAVTALQPQDLGRLREADLALRVEQVRAGVRIEELEIEALRIDAGDRASARQREVSTGDWTPRVLAFGLLLLWFITQHHILTATVDPSMRELVQRVLSTIDAAFMLVLGYYFGSSASSARKTAAIEKLGGK